MIRKSKHGIEETLSTYRDVMDNGERSHSGRIRGEFDGDSIKFSSHRLWTFNECGVTCVNCGLEADFFAKEKGTEHEESFHLNLYALDSNGDEVLLTKDHIVPQSKDGDDHISNYQTMCAPCNNNKGDGE